MSSNSPDSPVARYEPCGPRNFSAFHSAALWLAPIEIPPAALILTMACWMTGVETTPRSITSWPVDSRPAMTPSRIMMPLARGSRPITILPGASRNVPNAAAKSSTCAAVSPGPTMPRKPTCEMRRLPSVPIAIIPPAAATRRPPARDNSAPPWVSSRSTSDSGVGLGCGTG